MPKHSAEVLSSVPKAMMCLMEKMRVFDKRCATLINYIKNLTLCPIGEMV